MPMPNKGTVIVVQLICSASMYFCGSAIISRKITLNYLDLSPAMDIYDEKHFLYKDYVVEN